MWPKGVTKPDPEPERVKERNVSEVPSVRKKKRPKRESLNLNIPVDLKAKIAEIADDAGITMTAWAIMTLRRAVRNWDAGLDANRRRKAPKLAPTKAAAAAASVHPSGWPKDEPCFICFDKHDPTDAHPSTTQEDVDFMLRAFDRE
jgi:hypothetical protein